MKRWLKASCASDKGSGTLVGIALIAVVAMLLGVVGVAGRVFYAQARAQTGADSAAFAAAAALNGVIQGVPCTQAGIAANANDVQLSVCEQKGNDAQISVEYKTGIPLFSTVQARSRAGPDSCQ